MAAAASSERRAAWARAQGGGEATRPHPPPQRGVDPVQPSSQGHSPCSSGVRSQRTPRPATGRCRSQRQAQGMWCSRLAAH